MFLKEFYKFKDVILQVISSTKKMYQRDEIFYRDESTLKHIRSTEMFCNPIWLTSTGETVSLCQLIVVQTWLLGL